jgi:Xaa-Pro aminopeptidase
MNRLLQLRGKLKEAGLDGILLVNDSNIRYVSDFTGSDSYVVVTAQDNAFITDSRYTEQAESQCKDFRVIRWGAPASLVETVKEVCEKNNVKKLAFESNKLLYSMFESLSKGLEGIELVPTQDIVEDIRCIKDEEEIECLRKAAAIADEAFTEILKVIKVGMTEKDIERELQYLIKKKGAEDISFPSIVASGKRSSLPHAIPSDKVIEEGDFITLDFGATYGGYHSDMTRTIIVGCGDEKQKEIYRIVKEAQEAGSRAVKAGVKGNVPDAAARGHIAQAGYGAFFGHGLGHGVGLDIHEGPGLSAKGEKLLAAGNAVTVEPGIYLPDWGGVRIEDTVIIREGHIEVITKSTKELIEL